MTRKLKISPPPLTLKTVSYKVISEEIMPSQQKISIEDNKSWFEAAISLTGNVEVRIIRLNKGKHCPKFLSESWCSGLYISPGACRYF